MVVGSPSRSPNGSPSSSAGANGLQAATPRAIHRGSHRAMRQEAVWGMCSPRSPCRPNAGELEILALDEVEELARAFRLAGPYGNQIAIMCLGPKLRLQRLHDVRFDEWHALHGPVDVEHVVHVANQVLITVSYADRVLLRRIGRVGTLVSTVLQHSLPLGKLDALDEIGHPDRAAP